MIERFVNFIFDFNDGEYKEKVIDTIAKDKKSLYIDYGDLLIFDSDLAHLLLDEPDEVLSALNEALKVVIDRIGEKTRLFGRIVNLPKSLKISELESDHIHKFVQIEGIITSRSDIKPYLSNAVWVCNHCRFSISVNQKPYLPIKRPAECPNCGKKSFSLDIDGSIFINLQSFKIQDIPETTETGDVVILDGYVTDDLCDSFVPGDRVILTGILRVYLDKQDKKPIFRKVFEVNGIKVLTQQIKDIEITKEEIMQIKELAKRDDIEKLIVRSIAPSIEGRDDLKYGLALSLFSGGDIVSPDGLKVRGESHILIVGDPATAKSQLIDYLRMVIPRGIITNAKMSTSAGLTAIAMRDKTTGSWVIEAGALVKATGGICVIDEFDKMDTHDKVAIHEALEQQRISIAKANISTTLPAKTTVIAVANPKYGKFKINEPFIEQIDLPPSLISRFDLIFTIVDKPDPETDLRIAKHILKFKIQGKTKNTDVIPPELLKKYIAYTRQNIHPELTDEAVQYLADYYVKMRKKVTDEDGLLTVPITARQLEALVRLSRARARMMLRNYVTIEDVKKVTEFWEDVMSKILQSDEGILDINIIELGKSTKQMSKTEKIISIIEKLQKENEIGAYLDDIIEEAKKLGIEKKDVIKIIEGLHTDGRLYEPQYKYYKLSL